MFRLSQETIALVTAGLAPAGLGIAGDNGIRSEMQAMRAEARADREALRAEARADREAWRAEADAAHGAIHSEARADREAFEKHITRPTQERSRLTGLVERMRASR